MEGKFPQFAKFERDILMITGSSVESESAFPIVETLLALRGLLLFLTQTWRILSN